MMNLFLKKYFEKIILKIMLWTMIGTISLGLTLFYLHTFDQKEMLSTEIGNRSSAVGNSIVSLVENAVQLGIPFEQMVGMSKFLNKSLKTTPDLSYIAITDTKGDILYQSDGLLNALKNTFKQFATATSLNLKPFDIDVYNNIPLIIKDEQHTYGFLHLGVSKKATSDRIADIYYDILTILFVAMLAGFEFFIFIFRNNVQNAMTFLITTMRRIIEGDYTLLTYIHTKSSIGQITEKLNTLIESICLKYHLLSTQIQQLSRPKNAAEQALETLTKSNHFPANEPLRETLSPMVENLRLPAFLMVIAETVLIAILPSYAAQFYDPSLGIPKEIIMGSPVFTFMIFSMLGVAISNKISYRVGFKKSIMMGLFLAIIGYFIAFLMDGLGIMILARAITALGYGIAYANFQNYIAAYSPSNNKIQSYAIFAIAYGSAFICGAPIGGILVDNLGYNYTFFMAAISACISILFVRRFIVDSSECTLQKALKSPVILLKNRALMSMIVFAGLPARFMFSSLICLFYPLYLSHLGFTQSSVGRNLMIYGIIMFVFSNYAAKFVEKFRSKSRLILLGCGSLLGVAIVMPIYVSHIAVLEASLVLYSLSSITHTCAVMAMLEKFSVHKDDRTKEKILSYYFIAERIGLILGPATVSLLLLRYDFSITMKILSGVILTSTLIYGVFTLTEYVQKDKQCD